MMKTFIPILLAVMVFLPCVTGATEAGAGKAKLKQETDKLSVLLLVKQYEKDFSEKSVAPAAAVLYNTMLEHPSDNVRVADARQNLDRVFAEELEKITGAELENLFHSVGKDWQSLKSMIPAGELDDFMQKCQNKYFLKSFTAVRKRVVAEQKEQVFHKVYPSEEELEAKSDEELVKLLEERFRAGLKAPLWEENEILVRRELIEPVILSARRQQKLQLELAGSTAVPWEHWSEKSITGYLEKEVLQGVKKKLEENEKSYQIFPKTREIIVRRAGEIPRERVIAAFPQRIAKEPYRKFLEADPEAHARFAKSLELVQDKMIDGLVTQAFQKSGIPADVGELLRNDEQFKAAAKENFLKLSDALKAVRCEFAETQLRAWWPALSKGEWIPELEESQIYAAGGSKEVPRLRTRPKEKEELLEETLELSEVKVREALTKEVLRLEAQKKCVAEIYNSVQAEMAKRQEKLQGGKSEGILASIFPDANITLKGVVRRYEEMVLEKCAMPLFPAVEEEIEVRSRAILMAIIEPETQKEAPNANPETLREVTIPVIIDGSRGKVTIAVDKWEKRYSEEKINVKEVAEAIVKRMKAEKEPATFILELQVRDGKIYYRTVAELQSELEKILNCKIGDSLQK